MIPHLFFVLRTEFSKPVPYIPILLLTLESPSILGWCHSLRCYVAVLLAEQLCYSPQKAEKKSAA